MMMTWYLLRRFQVVSIDVLDASKTLGNTIKKADKMWDFFTRFVWAVPIRDESSRTLARVILDKWILKFVPPENLLSDRGPSLSS